MNGTLRILIVVLFPFVVFFVVAAAQATASGRTQALAESHPPNPRPLNMRLSYSVADVDVFWDALGSHGRAAERLFLLYDLTFPFFYVGTLAFSLLWLSRRAGWTPLIVLAPVVGGIADWAENLIQLNQLRAYSAKPGVAALDPTAVRLSSVATDVKLLGVAIGFALVVVLGVVLIVRRVEP
jgi:hypothetical protein